MEAINKSAKWKVALAYGLPNFGLAILLGPVQGLLQGYFTKHYEVKLEQIAWIFSSPVHVALMIGLSINIVLFVALGPLQPSTGEAVLLGKPAVF
jgi:Na+/melibiose symporter-like transporter